MEATSELETLLKENQDKYFAVIKRYNFDFKSNNINDILTDSSLYFALKGAYEN
jgi:hypothetical protein